jgi:hydroxyacylglutathione hydrolase
VFIASFPAGPWQTNCYVVATAPGEECVIIDPGMDASAGVAQVVTEHRLKPVAAVLTHGHLDHMFSVTPLCRQYESVCWIHPDDRVLLTDPLRAMSDETRVLLSRLTSGTVRFVEPDDVRELVDGVSVALAGLTFDAIHAPGHTPGSVMFRSPYADGAPDQLGGGQIDSVVFSGDVLFAGSIGRTDLPGGSHADMLKSLRRRCCRCPTASPCCPVTVRRPRWPGNGLGTRTCKIVI